MVIIVTYYLIASWFILLVFYNILSHEKYKQRQKFNTYIDAIYKKNPLVIEKTIKPLILRDISRISKEEDNSIIYLDYCERIAYIRFLENLKPYINKTQEYTKNGDLELNLTLTIYDTREQFAGRTTRDNGIESTRVG